MGLIEAQQHGFVGVHQTPVLTLPDEVYVTTHGIVTNPLGHLAPRHMLTMSPTKLTPKQQRMSAKFTSKVPQKLDQQHLVTGVRILLLHTRPASAREC